jgi:hypothetical protein
MTNTIILCFFSFAYFNPPAAEKKGKQNFKREETFNSCASSRQFFHGLQRGAIASRQKYFAFTAFIYPSIQP